MTAASDPYRILGLEPGASQADIKRAYRRLAKTLHPDSAGERSLPAFLAVQEAYERLTGTKVRTVRLPGAPPGSGSPPPGSGAAWDGPASGRPGFREPWRADPARASAAREQARTRRATSGPGPGANAAGGPTSWPGGPGRSAEPPGAATPGARPRRPRSGPASAPGARDARSPRGAGDAPGGAAGGRRRRATRKATMGSTSYDEARDAADPRWAGASWYGPTTGEYWIVNPREYADPRKHGPGYSGRLRTSNAPIDQALDDNQGATGRPPEPRAGPASERSPRPTGEERGPGVDQADDVAAAAAPPSGLHPRSPTSASSAPAPDSAATVRDDSFLDSLVRPGSRDPLRRLGLVLLAWAPLGVAAAAIIGQLTGCGSYSVACQGSDPFLPWLAQAIILGLLLLAPPLARLFAAGTVGLLVALAPATAGVIALGGARSSAAPPVLAAILVIGWILGTGWGFRRMLGSR
jgi:hypothetical protein